MSIKNIFGWLDKNILTILTALLIVIIPLYPKIPLADILPGYIVRIRLEDFAVMLVFLIFSIQLLRKKVALPKYRVAKLIYAYLAIGFLSTLSAIYLTKTVPMIQDHIMKVFLHFFRRVEYFSLFFIAYAAIRSAKQVKLFFSTLIVTSIAVALYGFGQKYLYWPAFSTMNREFSKGTRLYLAPNSRVMSTFAGHYDLAAYVMMLLAFIVPLTWLTKNRLLKIGGILTFIALYWTLILTASRTSFIGYVAGITVVSALLVTIKGFKWVLPRWFFVMLFSFTVLVTLGDLSERFMQVLGIPAERRNITIIRDALLKPFRKEPPPNAISDEDMDKIAAKSDQPPTTDKPLPPDITKEEDDLRKALEASQSATPAATPSGGGYSPNALKYGLSVAIRLDALWPRAIEGFKRNPILGSGYSTLVKTDVNDFTYAESTDNDYLRMLGETGLLGTLAFLAIPILMSIIAIRNLKIVVSNYDKALLVGFVGATVALLVNATYIDVFESSKVVYTYWLIAAVILKVIEYSRSKREKILY